MTFLLIAGEFDLSVGSFFAFCPVLMFTLHTKLGIPLVPGFILTLGVCALLGLVNGILVTKVGISSFLTTIGMMLIVRGASLVITNGFPQASWNTESILKPLLSGSVQFGDFEIFASLPWFIVILTIMIVVLRNMRVGNWIFATGGNAKAAKARGIDTDRLKIGLFILSALMASFAGTIDAFRISAVYPIAGQGYELEVIAMVVIGGTSLLGGSGTLVGTVIGVMLLRAMRNGIIVMGVPGMAYNIFVGAIILAMMAIHSVMEKKARGE
jgi:simple sugar transport system permease protein